MAKQQISNSISLLHQRPSNEEVEKTVIGTIIAYPESYVLVSSILCEDSFYDENLREIYAIVKKNSQKGISSDLVVVSEDLMMKYTGEKLGDITYKLAECVKSYCDYSNIVQSAKILEHYRQQRLYLELGEWLSFSAGKLYPDDLAKKVIKYQERIASAEVAETYDKNKTGMLIKSIVDENQKPEAPSTRTWTGFRIFDEEGGFLPGKLIVVAAMTSQGKTALSLSFVYNAMKQGQSVAIYSMEMDHLSIGVRMMNIAGLGLKESIVLHDRLINPKAVSDAADAIKQLPGNFYVDDSANTSIDKIIESIRLMKRKYNIVGAVVDYIQILNVYSKSGKNQEQILADAARLLQAEAKNSGIWVLVLSQISRNVDPGQSHDPSADKLRGSGQILEAADMSILLYRPEVYKEQYPGEFSDVDTHNTALLKLTKCRGGASQKAEIVHFYPEQTYFKAFEEGERFPRFYSPQAQQQSTTPF